MPADAPVMRAVPFVVVLMGVSLVLMHPHLRPSEIWRYMAKSRAILSKYGRGADGSPGSDVDLPGSGRDRQPVGCGAAIENATANGQPQGLRARVAPADKAVQPVEPQAGPHRRRQLLFC